MSMHTPKKSTNMSSAIGLMPSAAAPIAAPINPVSEIGVSMTRSLPCLASKPPVAPKMPPYLPMSSPITKTFASRCNSWSIASAMAPAMVSLRVVLMRGSSVSVEDVPQRVLGLRVRALAREVVGRGDARVHARAQRGVGRVVEHALAPQLGAERRDRVVLAQLVGLAFRTIGLRVALEVAEVAVGAHFEQRRAVAAACALDRGAGGLVDRDRVVAVDQHPGHAVGCGRSEERR